MIPTEKSRNLKIAVIIFLLIIPLLSVGQPRLVLSKLGNKNKILFFEGDLIQIKVSGSDNYVGGLILGLRDSLIHFRYFDVYLKDIEEINIDGISFGGFNTGQYGKTIMVAGIMYFGIDLLNQGDVTTETIIYATGISGLGYVLWLTRRKKFKIRKRNRIHIFN